MYILFLYLLFSAQKTQVQGNPKTAWDDSHWTINDITNMCTDAIAFASRGAPGNVPQPSQWSVQTSAGNLCIKILTKTTTTAVSTCFPVNITAATQSPGEQC